MNELGELVGGLLGVGASVGVQVACAVIAAAIFAAKGRSWVGGAFLGFFLGPFGVFIAIVAGPWHRALQRPPSPRPVPQAPPPQPTNTYAPPNPQPPPVVYRLPGRCPECNGPVYNRSSNAKSISCWYCGSLIEGTPASA